MARRVKRPPGLRRLGGRPAPVDRRRTADNAIRVVEKPTVVADAVLFVDPSLDRDLIEWSPAEQKIALSPMGEIYLKHLVRACWQVDLGPVRHRQAEKVEAHVLELASVAARMHHQRRHMVAAHDEVAAVEVDDVGGLGREVRRIAKRLES